MTFSDNCIVLILKILTLDFTAKIGANSSGYEHAMGKHGLGRMNENRELLAEFCAFNNMDIGGSMFFHKVVHKTTWPCSRKPDTENCIVHVCIGQNFRWSLQNMSYERCRQIVGPHLHSIWSDAKYRKTPEQATTWIIWGTEEQQTAFTSVL